MGLYICLDTTMFPEMRTTGSGVECKLADKATIYFDIQLIAKLARIMDKQVKTWNPNNNILDMYKDSFEEGG